MVAGQRPRPVPVDVYLPATEGQQQRPVVVLSHGFRADRGTFEDLGKHFASHGMTAVVIEHTGSTPQMLLDVSNGQHNEVMDHTDFVERPQDVTFVLNDLEQRSQSDPKFRGLNLDRVGIIGHSTGGYTALALAGANLDVARLQQPCSALPQPRLNPSLGLQCKAQQLPVERYDLKDDRIQAVVTTQSMQRYLLGRSVKNIQVPVMVMSGSKDWVAPAVEEQICPFTWLTTPNKYLLLVKGGDHFMGTGKSFKRDPFDQFLNNRDVASLQRPTPTDRYLQALGTAFFKTYIGQESAYQAYLTTSYAHALNQAGPHNQATLPLTFTTALPANLSLRNCPSLDHP